MGGRTTKQMIQNIVRDINAITAAMNALYTDLDWNNWLAADDKISLDPPPDSSACLFLLFTCG